MGKASKQKRERKEAKHRRTTSKWTPLILPATLSIAFFIFSNYGASMLTNVSPTWGYILFLSSTSIVLGWWVWKVIGWTLRKNRFTTHIKAISVCFVVLAIMITSPYYIGHFVKAQGSIEMPTFIDDSAKIKVHYGNKTNEFMWAQKSIGELKQEPMTAFGINNQDIFYIHIEGNKLYVDTSLFAGIENQSQHVFSPPVVITNNAFSRRPDGWKIEQSNTALEISNENDIPVLILKYDSPYEITIWGLFITPMGICKVDNSEGTVFLLGDTLSELGTYKVDRIFIHSIFDLFKSERTYILHD